jgi:hypothetical protein
MGRANNKVSLAAMDLRRGPAADLTETPFEALLGTKRGSKISRAATNIQMYGSAWVVATRAAKEIRLWTLLEIQEIEGRLIGQGPTFHEEQEASQFISNHTLEEQLMIFRKLLVGAVVDPDRTSIEIDRREQAASDLALYLVVKEQKDFPSDLKRRLIYRYDRINDI